MDILRWIALVYLLVRYIYFRRKMSRIEEENRLMRLELTRTLSGPVSDEQWLDIMSALKEAFGDGYYTGPSAISVARRNK